MLLNCHTYYSYKYGTISIEDLIKEALKEDYNYLVLTDINNTSASLDFVRQCMEKHIKPVLGIDFRNGAQQQYIGIARNNKGFRELNKHLTHHLHTSEDFDDRGPEFRHAYVIYPFANFVYQELRENEFVGIHPSEVTKIQFSKWKNCPNKLVILHPVSIRNKRDFNIHRLLRAIDNNTLLSKLPKREEAQPDEIMPTENELAGIFHEHPQIIENTKQLIKHCAINFDYKIFKNKKCFTNSPKEDFELLKKEAGKGIKYRYKNPTQKVIDRMNKELKIIKQMDFCSYFLINWDLVKHARIQGVYHVGRGSGANSMLAYLLRITDVDPIELDLYFERFINPARTSPPDFDLDFPSRDRNKMTKYLFDKYGWDKTALVGTYITFQYKSMIRELGKVFGLPTHEIEKLQATKNFNDLDEISKLVIRYSHYIHGFPSHLSVHSSGILISEEPLNAYTATLMPPKGFPTVHFSMIEAEDIGYTKFDILGQRGLSKIEDAVAIVKENTGQEIDIHDIMKFKQDETVKQLLMQGKTIGCFYVESPAMRMLLKKLEADDYIRLVAASSIIRPGVAKSGMMREYILRYREKGRREAARKEMPALYDLLAETYGVMVYQEDVIKVAHYFAGLTLAESDVLRRGMSWKFKQRNEFGKIRDKFFSNCKHKGYPKHLVERVWAQIESFANYAFSKGHSASYAVESYQALYLKAHFPLEYMVATINNGGGFYHTELYVHEARIHGGIVEPPCVNMSEGKTIICNKTIYLGLSMLKSLETNAIVALLTERARNGHFHDLRNFLNRVPISLEQLSILIRIDAFRFTGKQKKELMWDAHFLLSKAKRTKPVKTLFYEAPKEFIIPPLYAHTLESAYDEMELLGFPVGISPFKLVEMNTKKTVPARMLPYIVNKRVEVIGYLIHEKRTRTTNRKQMTFGTFIDREGNWIDTVQFPNITAKYPFRGPGCYKIKGKVISEFGFVSIETSELYRLTTINIEEPSTRLRPNKEKPGLIIEYDKQNANNKNQITSNQ